MTRWLIELPEYATPDKLADALEAAGDDIYAIFPYAQRREIALLLRTKAFKDRRKPDHGWKPGERE